MPPFRLTRLVMRAGPGPSQPPSELAPGRVTLLVGPNNSGKSKTLQELGQWANQGQQPPVPWPGGDLVARVDVEVPPTRRDVEGFLEARRLPSTDPPRIVHIHAFQLLHVGPGGGQGTAAINLDPPNATSPDAIRQQVMPHYTVSLDGKSRFQLVEGRQLTALDQPATNHWMALERDPARLAEVNAMVHAAFGEHLVMTTLTPPNVLPALSEAPMPKEFLQSTSPAAILFQKAARPLNQFSDGVQVFTGLVAALSVLPHLLLLIDEPEAFLHPTLARRLGGNLARIARQREANLVAATHSAEFLMGCVAEVPETTVIRLAYRRTVATARILAGVQVAELTRNPLLRSAEALRALFAEAAVVCESDSDRAFYDEINRRLMEEPDRMGTPDTIFLNAQNWQTTPVIAKPLRQAGVPAAVVVDLDAVIHGEHWPAFWGMAGLDAEAKDRLGTIRATAAMRLRALGRGGERPDGPWRAKTEGLTALDPVGRAEVDKCLAALAEIGIFVVSVGELERWLPQFRHTNKQTWVTDMLVSLGSQGSGAYVRPGEGDVWAFLEEVAGWTTDPGRRGMPL